MNSSDFSSSKCAAVVKRLLDLLPSNKEISNNLSSLDITQLGLGCDAKRLEEVGDMINSPMLLIGIYVAIASFICVLAMVADLVHGLLNRKFWMPCKYFSLNAKFITLMAVAMTLPVDLTTPMQGYMDLPSRLVSVAFMAIMMINLMPSLASMDNRTLVANVIGLSLLAITVIVNTCIQIHSSFIPDIPAAITFTPYVLIDWSVAAYIYVVFIIVILIITIASSLAIPASKQILDSKYQAKNKELTDQDLQPIDHVRRYWVMAETGSPQFVMANNPLSVASGVICEILMLVNLCVLILYMSSLEKLATEDHVFLMPTNSPYKWSMRAIITTQGVGVVVGSISPILRQYSVYEVISRQNRMLFTVEDYWTKILQDWKQHRILFLSSCPILRRFIHNSKDFLLSWFCIQCQKGVVKFCKMISLIPLVHSLYVTIIKCTCWLPLLMAEWCCGPPSSSQPVIDPDLNNYVLKIDDVLEIAVKTRNRIFESVYSYISKAEKKQNNNLFELIERSTGFEGVATFDNNQAQPLPSLEVVNSWSLPIVTLTCIAGALPSIPNDRVRNLFESVNEGLSYTHLVEESLNCEDKYLKLQKVSMALWLEVDNKCHWLGNHIAQDVFIGKTARETVTWFFDEAKAIMTLYNVSTNQNQPVENMDTRLIAANSMYRITETISRKFPTNIQTEMELFVEMELFDDLKGRIADIFGACFTNIPQVVKMKCREGAIEKRVANVKVAAKVLGKTTKIRGTLDARQLPPMDVHKKAYIDEWREKLRQPVP